MYVYIINFCKKLKRLHIKKTFLGFLILLNVLMLYNPALAASPANTGFVGLWEYPTAELPGDGMGWVHYSKYSPFSSCAVNLGMFPWLEFNLRLTEYENEAAKQSAGLSDAFGYYKDKGLDLKLLLANQQGLRPAIAAGVIDMMGTELRKGYFGAATWKYKQAALTLGYGTNMYNGFYGGIAWSPLEWLEFKAEFSPMDYKRERVAGIAVHPNDADSKFNYGVVFKSQFGLMGSLSYQRGEELCFGVSYAYDLNKPLLGGKHPPKPGEVSATDWDKTDIKQMASSLQEVLGARGFGLRNVVVLAGEQRVHIAYENIGYASQSQALARVIIYASRKIPWDAESVSFVMMARGVPVSFVKLNKEQMALVRMDKLAPFDIEPSDYSWADKAKYGIPLNSQWDVMAGPGESRSNGWGEIRAALAFEPRIDKDIYKRVYMMRTDIDWTAQLRSSYGWGAYLKIRQPIHNDIEIEWEPETNSSTRIWRGVFSYLHKFDKHTWALGEIGWIDENYFGTNLWGRYYFPKTNIWAGVRISVTKERDFDSFASLSNYKWGLAQDPNSKRYHGVYLPENGDNDWNVAYWAEGGYHDSTYNADLKVLYGKFATGDSGYRVDAIRNWDAVKVGFYYTNTDIKSPEKGFTDAGMILHLPLSVLYDGHTSITSWDQQFTLLSYYALFAGKIPGAWQSPEQLIGELQPERLYQETGRQLMTLTAQMNGEKNADSAKNTDTYGILEYVTQKWRNSQISGDDM